MSDLQRIDDSGGLHLNFAVDEGAKAKVMFKLIWTCRHNKGPPQVLADFRYQNSISSYHKFHSVPTELDHDDTRRIKIDNDEEMI